MSSEQRAIYKFKKLNEPKIDIISNGLKIIRNAYGKDFTRNGLSNVGIVYNNKIMEITRIFHEHDLDLFDGNLTSRIMFYTIDNTYGSAIQCIDQYLANNIGTYYNEYFFIRKNPGNELVRYKKLTDFIWEYDIKKDFINSLEEYCHVRLMDPVFEFMLFYNRGNMKDSIRSYLTRLGYADIVDECFEIIDNEYLTLRELLEEEKIKFRKLNDSDGSLGL